MQALQHSSSQPRHPGLRLAQRLQQLLGLPWQPQQAQVHRPVACLQSQALPRCQLPSQGFNWLLCPPPSLQPSRQPCTSAHTVRRQLPPRWQPLRQRRRQLLTS